MRFDKKTYKVDINTLNIIEADEFDKFLRRERSRHVEVYTRCNARAQFWGSEATRQAKEIETLDVRLNEVGKRFEL